MIRSPWLPRVAGLATALVGAVDVASAPTPDAGIALLVLSVYLGRRRRRALVLAVGLLALLGGLELVRGLEVTETLAAWTLAAVLWLARGAFVVRHEPATPRQALLHGALLAAAAVGMIVVAPGPVLVAPAAALAAAAWLVFRPLHTPVHAVTVSAQRRVRRLVQEHGEDTLSAFKLRPDLPRFMASDGRAFCSYRVKHGVLLIAGDPVGPADALPGLMLELSVFAVERGHRRP